MLLSNNHKVSAALAAAAVMLSCTPVQAAFDGFNVLSSTFANQYDGNDIFDGAATLNGWAAAGGAESDDLVLNGSNVQLTYDDVNGWIQQDNGTTPWELGSGSWTVEVRARVNSIGSGNSGFVIWGALNGNRDILAVRENAVSNLAGTVFDSSNNTSGFNDFRLVYDADSSVYHYFRNAVPLTPVNGVAPQSGTGNTRLIIGDCCTNIGANPFGGLGESFEIEYIRYDMTGAFSPTVDQGVTSVTVNRDTGNITLTNTTSTPIEGIVGYSLLSNAGGLTSTGWNTQTNGSQLANDNDDWTTVTSLATELAEVIFTTSGDGDGGELSASTGTWNYGNVWTKSPFEDVRLELLLDDGNILTSGTDFQLSFAGNGDQPFAIGDLAGATVNEGPDGDIDLVDWQKFKAIYGSDVAGLTTVAAYFAGDLNSDGAADFGDFLEFRTAYDAANGAGAFAAAISGTPVPEPAACLLAGVAAAGYFFRRRGFTNMHSIGHFAWLLSACLLLFAEHGNAQISVEVFSDDFQTYPLSDPADFSPTGNWTHNGNGTAPNASRIFDTINYGGTRLWIASAADATAGTGLNSRGITQAEGLVANTDYTFSAAFVTETSIGTRTASGSYDLLVGQSFATATSVIGGPQAFAARGDFDATVIGSVAGTYDDQRTTLSFNSGVVNPGDQLFITFAFDGTDASNPFVGADDIQVIYDAAIGARVNTTTGEVSLFGDSIFDFDVTGYSLTSALGQLLPSSLTSLESQGIGDGAMTPDDGIGFELLGTPSATEIAEGHLTTFTTFDGTTDLSLGNIFNTSTAEGDRDLSLTFTTAAGLQLPVAVEYFSSIGVEGDYNGDGSVNLADYTLWRDNLGAADESAINNNGDGGGITASDYTFWKQRFGNTAGSGSLAVGSAAVPEPAAFALLGLAAATVVGTRLGRTMRLAGCAMTCLLALAATASAAENDRQYDFGDDPSEPATANSFMSGTTFDSAGTPGAGDLQDLTVNGSPTYVSVSDRPGALAGDLGASFNGSSDSLATPVSLNAPAQMWDNATFFPGTPANPVFPLNYEGIFSHGIQVWAKPDQSALGTPESPTATQTLVSDTNEHGIGINANGNWELLYDDGRFDTGLAVVDTLDENGWVHVMQMTQPTGGAFGGTLLVNGVAVITRSTFYDPEATPLVIGADAVGTSVEDGFENFYDGTLDDVKLFFWGDNSNQLGADGLPGGINSGGPDPTPIVLNADGQDWGGVGFMRSASLDRPGGVTNEWIAHELATMGVTDAGDVDLSGGSADAADQAAFISHWRKRFTLDGIQIGDWNTRQEGDLNYDGVVDLRDAFILHEALTASGAGGFNFALLDGTSVPEPATVAIAVMSFALASGVLRWQRS